MTGATNGCIEKKIRLDIQWRPPAGKTKVTPTKWISHVNAKGTTVYDEVPIKGVTHYRRNRGRFTIKLMKDLINSGVMRDLEDTISDRLNAMERRYPASVLLDPMMKRNNIRTDKWKTEVYYSKGDAKNEWYEIGIRVRNMQENTPYEIVTDPDPRSHSPPKRYRGVMYNLAALRLTKRVKHITVNPEKHILDTIGKGVSNDIDDSYDYYDDFYESDYMREERERIEKLEWAESQQEWVNEQRHELDNLKTNINLSMLEKTHAARSELTDMSLKIKSGYTDRLIQARTELFDTRQHIDDSYRRIDELNRATQLRKKLRAKARQFANLVKRVGMAMAKKISAYEALHPGETIDTSIYDITPKKSKKKKSTKKKNK